MKVKEKPLNSTLVQKLPKVFGIVGLFTSVISLIFLTINVNNWANIAAGSPYAGGSVGVVGKDAPLIYPVALSFLFILISYITSRQKITKFQLSSLVIILSVVIIWGFALGFATMNPFQS